VEKMIDSTTTTTTSHETEDRTAMIAARLKKIYKKSILPVEKRYRYDYFFESPLLSDVEFDCKYEQRKTRPRLVKLMQRLARFFLHDSQLTRLSLRSSPLSSMLIWSLSETTSTLDWTIFCRKDLFH
jgi:hypothetical protein